MVFELPSEVKKKPFDTRKLVAGKAGSHYNFQTPRFFPRVPTMKIHREPALGLRLSKVHDDGH